MNPTSGRSTKAAIRMSILSGPNTHAGFEISPAMEMGMGMVDHGITRMAMSMALRLQREMEVEDDGKLY